MHWSLCIYINSQFYLFMTKKIIKTQTFLNFRVFDAAALNATGMNCTQIQFHKTATAALQGMTLACNLSSCKLQPELQLCKCIKCKKLPVLDPRVVYPALQRVPHGDRTPGLAAVHEKPVKYLIFTCNVLGRERSAPPSAPSTWPF